MAKDLPVLNALGFAKAPQDTRVVVAMSGGVDSSVVAALLAEQGFEVIGLTMQLYDHGQALKRKGACCAGRDIHDARRVAERLGIAHYVLDYESSFKEAVIEDFAETYLAGATPVPCIRCNERVKFSELLATAQDLGADCMATGHYVQRLQGEGGAEMHCGADSSRDQSYFLFSTTKAQLDYLRFPLGGLQSKTETRALAERYGLEVADKPDSQDICFVPDGDYAAVIKKLRPEAAQPGVIRHVDGRELGRHDGVVHYTIGQRRGLGIGGLSEPLFVVRLDIAAHEVIVGPREMLAKQIVPIETVTWLGEGGFSDAPYYDLAVKLRSTRPPREARITPLDDTRAEVELLAPEYGVSPGQACVFYEPGGTRVLGGGWIARG